MQELRESSREVFLLPRNDKSNFFSSGFFPLPILFMIASHFPGFLALACLAFSDSLSWRFPTEEFLATTVALAAVPCLAVVVPVVESLLVDDLADDAGEDALSLVLLEPREGDVGLDLLVFCI